MSEMNFMQTNKRRSALSVFMPQGLFSNEFSNIKKKYFK